MGGSCSRHKSKSINEKKIFSLRKKKPSNTHHFGLCPDCNLPNTDKSQYGWCRSCNSSKFEKSFGSWTSHNSAIDDFIRESQKNANNHRQILEWIPYARLQDVQFVAKGGFDCNVYSATWPDGNILYWDSKKKSWVRRSSIPVALKMFENSCNITAEFFD